MNRKISPGRWFVFLAFLAFVIPAVAEDIKIEAKLIWATNDEKSPDPTHKVVDPKLAEEFRKIFTWKNYFEVSRTNGVVPSRGTRPFKVSNKCVIEITELEGPKVEVKLIGEGKPVNKTTKALSRGHYFTLGGESKNGSAWFVVITQLDDKESNAATIANQAKTVSPDKPPVVGKPADVK